MKDLLKNKTVGWALVLGVGLLVSTAGCDRDTSGGARAGADAPGADTSGAGASEAGGAAAPVAGGSLVAGDARVEGGLITPGVSRFRMSASANGEARELGTLTQEVTRVNEGGRDLLRMVMSMDSPAGDGVDTAYVDAKTLAPVRLRGHNTSGTISLDFNGAKVLGNKVDADGKVQPVTQTTEAPAFDASVIDFLVTALPLSLGYTARLPVFMVEQGGLAWYNVRVVGDVIVSGEPAYGVDVQIPVGVARYSIAKNGRRLLSSTITFSQSGGVITMTRLPD